VSKQGSEKGTIDLHSREKKTKEESSRGKKGTTSVGTMERKKKSRRPKGGGNTSCNLNFAKHRMKIKHWVALAKLAYR